MVDGALFDKLEQIGRMVRGNEKPFGGLQVSIFLAGQARTSTNDQIIVSGDFFQLPPISRPGEPEAKYAFESASWSKVFPRENMSGLTQVFRQKDNGFVKLLESMRKGIVRPADTALLKRCDRKVIYADNLEPVGL